MRGKLQQMIPRKLNSSHRVYSVREIDLAFDLRERTYNSETFDSSSQDATMVSLKYSTDGDYLFLLGDTSDTIYGYSLCPYFDVTSAILDDSLDYSAKTTSAVDFTFNSAGTKVAVVEADGTVHEYTLSTPWDLGSGTFTQTIDDVAVSNVTSIIANDDGEYIVITSTGEAYNVTQVIQTNLNDLTSGITYTSSTAFSFTSFGSAASILTRDGTDFYIFNDQINWVYQYVLSTPYDFSTASVIDHVAVTTAAIYMYMSPDGKNMVLSYVSSLMHYQLSTAYDITSASLVNTMTGSDIGIYKPVWFNPTGTRVYYISVSDELSIRDLNTAWDVDDVDDLSGSDISVPASYDRIFMDSGGTQIYILNTSFDFKQFSLSDGSWGELTVLDGAGSYPGTPINPLSTNSILMMTEDGQDCLAMDTNSNSVRTFSVSDDGYYVENETALGTSLVSPGYPGAASTFYTLDTSAGSAAAYFLQSPGSIETMAKQYDTTITEISMTNVGAMDVSSDGANSIFLDTTTGIVYQLRIP